MVKQRRSVGVKSAVKTSASDAARAVDPDVSSASILQDLSDLHARKSTKAEYYRSAFLLLAEHFHATYGLLHARVEATEVQQEYRSEESCPDDILALADAIIIEAEAESRANVRLFAQPSAATIAVMSAPIYAGAEQIGTLCLATRVSANKLARALLSELIALLAFLASQHQHNRASSDATQRALHKIVQYESVQEFAYSLVNSIATKFGCEQVAFGILKDQQARVLAISGLDRFSRSSHGVVAIQQAMEECSDAAQVIHCQRDVESAPNGTFLLHRQWHRAANQASLLSVPLQFGENTILAVVSLQRNAERPFSDHEVQSIQQLLVPFAPAVHLLEKSQRGILATLRESITKLRTAVLAPQKIGRKIVALVTVAAAIFFVFGWLPFRVCVPCHIAPVAINHVSMPFQATLQEVFVEDGATVRQGQVLAKLDARPLELERQRLLAEISMHQIDMDASLSDRNVGAASVASATLMAAKQQLRIAEDRISKAEVVAPVSGVVIRGNLDQRIGQLLPFGDPLIEIGETNGMNVRLAIPEHLVHFVEVGDAGQFVSLSHPGRRIGFEVERITPMSVVENEKNVFTADGTMVGSPAWTRFGMEGTAKISTGWRPVWWIATHGMVNRIRFALWL